MPEQSILPLVEYLIVKKLGCIRCPQNATPYGVLIGTGPDGNEYTALACGSVIDLDKLEYLVDLSIKVIPSPNGLKVRPFSEQSEQTIQSMMERLESSDHQALPVKTEYQTHTLDATTNPVGTQLAELVITVNEQCFRKKIPVATWVCFPDQ